MPTKNLNEAVEKPLEYVLGIASDGKIGKMLPPSDGADGAPGPQGDPGVAGPAGDSAYEVWLGEGNVGTEADFLLDITGPPGPQGDPGTNGNNGVGVPSGGTAGQVLQKVDGTDYNTTWATPSGGGGGGAAGIHYLVKVPNSTQIDLSVNGTTAVTVAGATRRCDFVPFIPANGLTISRLYIEVTTLLASSTALVGVYSDVDGIPTSLLVQGDFGFDCGSTGQKFDTLSSSFTFTAGTTYWIACLTSGTQTLRAIPAGAQYSIGMANSSGARAGFRRATLASMALPATAPSTTLTSGSTPQVLLHKSA